MSLPDILQARRAGMKPGLVFVVAGDLSKDADGVNRVIVRSNDNPAAMDWSPMVGLTVVLVNLLPRPDLTVALLDALRAQGVKLFGAATTDGVFPLLVDADARHEQLLRRTWELLCLY
jgi:hypothetical protein